jgi:carbamate kinase
MRILVALGGNALLHRDEALTADNQRRNIGLAAEVLAPLATEHELVITHGNGPQVGLLALQNAAYKADESYPLDVLDAQTEGMIGYLIEQELNNLLPADIRCATILTQVEVDPHDPAFTHPSKPIGPLYDKQQAQSLARNQGWHIAPDGDSYRRVVPSPRPRRILELTVIELLLNQGIIVICAGGGGIPTVLREDGSLIGVEAVIDKDLASSLLAQELKANMFLMLTDVDAVYRDWGKPAACPIRRITPQAISQFAFEAGTMAPKVEAAVEFVEKASGIACIGALKDAQAMINGEAGTIIADDN